MKSVALCAIASLLLSFSCSTTDPPQYVRSIELRAEDASCTEAWLRVRITDGSQPPFDVRLTRDDQALQTYRLSTPDSLIIDEGLLPNRTYAYRGYRLTDSRHTDSTTLQTVTTMDTTSGNWVFDEPVLLGDGSSSVLYDVAIINDDNIWAVGELYLAGEPTRYNLARWDGSDWSIERVPYYYQGQPFYHPIQTVFAFGPDDIWFAGNGVIRWNGQQYIPIEIPPSVWGPTRINKIWGHDGEIWIVGNGGSIAHRNASGTWRRVESGTTLPFRDIYGAINPATNNYEVLAVASDPFHGFAKRIVSISNHEVSTVSDEGIPEPLSGVWFIPQRRYIAVGSGIFGRSNLFIGTWIGAPNQLTPYYSNSARGTAFNNIVVVGAFHDVLHFNGWRWRSYPELLASDRSWYSVSVETNQVIAVGSLGNRAVIMRGRR